MNGLKSVIITVPKSLTKAQGFATHKLNFTTSLLAENPAKYNRRMSTTEDETTMDSNSIIEHDEATICFRGKKRRLDHLTWEEKIQRKKLKNRVAAQTSRDRKRAKLDELEETVRILRERNEALAQECSALKSQNESLIVANTSLRREVDSKRVEKQVCSECQSRVGCVAPMQGSTVSPKYPLPQGGATKSAPVLTMTQPAATLWKILTLYLLSKNCLQTSKETITSRDLKSWPKAFCERLPPKWKQILINQVNKVSDPLALLLSQLLFRVSYQATRIPQVNFAKDAAQESSDTARMVGPASENVEADRTRRSIDACPAPLQSTGLSTTAAFCNRTADTVVSASYENDVKVKEETNLNDMDTVYGTYDESTNCITIIYPGHEEDIEIQESVQEVSSDVAYNDDESTRSTPSHKFGNYLSPAYTCADSMSPASVRSEDIDTIEPRSKLDSNLSDGGYESHGSPSTEIINTNATEALTDLWHESFSELFPGLA